MENENLERFEEGMLRNWKMIILVLIYFGKNESCYFYKKECCDFNNNEN